VDQEKLLDAVKTEAKGYAISEGNKRPLLKQEIITYFSSGHLIKNCIFFIWRVYFNQSIDMLLQQKVATASIGDKIHCMEATQMNARKIMMTLLGAAALSFVATGGYAQTYPEYPSNYDGSDIADRFRACNSGRILAIGAGLHRTGGPPSNPAGNYHRVKLECEVAGKGSASDSSGSFPIHPRYLADVQYATALTAVALENKVSYSLLKSATSNVWWILDLNMIVD
jgi:hypothetical protein